MKKILDLITEELKSAFEKAGYPNEAVTATVSNRPDLCEYQCNAAMPLAKTAHKAPLMIAEEVVAFLKDVPAFSMAEAVKPGFINLNLTGAFLSEYVTQMAESEKFGFEPEENPVKVMVDYGGPNVAKPLHIGHLRAAIIGESIKRICRFTGHETLGDVHLGDWGLQMGQIIAELNVREPELPYFDETFTGTYPEEAPFTISELEEIYPTASKKCKPESDTYDPAFAEAAHAATAELQKKRPGYMALWNHVLRISVADLKANYEKLDVHFDLWKGESDVQDYIPDMVRGMKEQGFAHESDGALVVDVAEETDKKELPPCIILKSDGATLYTTTDLATLVERMKLFAPGYIIYVVDKRQGLHFEQVFRTAKKTGIVPEDEKLFFLGFGTMNGVDGKPYKTRDGGVMRLETLIADITSYVEQKILENQTLSPAEAKQTAKVIAVAALKYGDLSNLATKDYIFDLERFSAFEGNTGPYLLYTIVRIKSILSRYGKDAGGLSVAPADSAEAKALQLTLAQMPDQLAVAYRDSTPTAICAYAYELAGAVNKFYHETRILTEPDEEKQRGYVALILLAKRALEECIDLLGFSAPDRM